MADAIKLIPLNQPAGNIQNNFSASATQVRIKTVQQVDDFNFPQARKAWEALIDAGMDPGELVANGLNIGHGYEITEKSMIAPIKSNQTEQLLGETQTTDDFLVGYKYSSTSELVTDAKLLSTSQNQPGLVQVSGELTITDNPTIKTVDLTAIVKNQAPQLNSSSNDQKKIE